MLLPLINKQSISQNEVVGFLWVDSMDDNAIDDDLIKTFQIIAEICYIAIKSLNELDAIGKLNK